MSLSNGNQRLQTHADRRIEYREPESVHFVTVHPVPNLQHICFHLSISSDPRRSLFNGPAFPPVFPQFHLSVDLFSGQTDGGPPCGYKVRPNVIGLDECPYRLFSFRGRVTAPEKEPNR